MNALFADQHFAGSVPEIYGRLLVPLLFESCVGDLARRLISRAPRRVLEIAAGTAVVTRRLAAALPGISRTVAADLNQAVIGEGLRPEC